MAKVKSLESLGLYVTYNAMLPGGKTERRTEEPELILSRQDINGKTVPMHCYRLEHPVATAAPDALPEPIERKS